jgi:hypothetical protein
VRVALIRPALTARKIVERFTPVAAAASLKFAGGSETATVLPFGEGKR